MGAKESSKHTIKRSTVATGLLILGLISLIVLFAYLLNTVRMKFSDPSFERLAARVEGKIASSIWRSVALLAQNGEDILAGNGENDAGGYLVSPVSYSADPRFTEGKHRIKLGKRDQFDIYLGHPKKSPSHGMIIPFALTRRDASEVGAEGEIKVGGITEYLVALAEREIYVKILSLEDGSVIADTTYSPEGGSFRGVTEKLDSMEKEISEFNVGIELFANHMVLEVPLVPQVLVILSFVFFASVIFFLHVRIIKPAALSVDLFQEKGGSLHIDLPSGVNQGNVFLNVNSLITEYSRLRETNLGMEKRLKEVEQGTLKELEKKHEELIIHHGITKKMLKALNKASVIPLLLEGIQELGYRDTLWGGLNREATTLEFNLDAPVLGRSGVTIPLLDETFFLSRLTWNGMHQFLEDPARVDCRYDERILMGEGPSLLIPVLKNQRTKCYQFFKCTSSECPAYMSSDQRCWIRGGGAGKCDLHSVVPTRSMKEACFNCDMFNVEGVLVISDKKGEGGVRADDTGVIMGLVNEASLALEISDLYEEKEKLSVTDSLTGLYNHREFFRLLEAEIDRAKRFNTELALLMIDVDNFKLINDTYGHLAGDAALKMISEALTRAVRKIDIVSRYGGEEFTVILPETDQGGAIVLAERIKSEVASLNISPVEDEKVTVTVSIGICNSRGGDMTSDQLVKRADDATYLAKKTGKNRVCISNNK